MSQRLYFLKRSFLFRRGNLYMKKIAIIGGGSAGLCTARHLLDPKYCSIFEPVIFEQKDCIGGTWVYEDYDINQPKKKYIPVFIKI